MVESTAVRTALHSIKPLCMELVQTPSAKSVQTIVKEMKSFEREVVQELQQFLIFPLRTALVQCIAKSLSQQLFIETCNALQLLLEKSVLSHPGLFMDLFTILTDVMFADSIGNATHKPLAEEEKLAAIKVLCALISSCQIEVLHDLYVPANVARLGSLVSQLVSVVSDTKNSRSLRTQAMDTLLSLLQKRTYRGKDDSWQHGNRFAGLLPGISTAMFKVLVGDPKQGHQLFCKALEVWTEVVCLTLGDESLQQEQKAGHKWIDELQMDARLKELIARRNEQWVGSVTPRVEMMVREVSRLKKHDSWRVRLQLVHWAQSLLLYCSQSVKCCLSPVLEVLVLLMTDSYHQVAAPATVALETYRDCHSDDDGRRRLVELLKEDLYSLVTSLPRRIKMDDEEEKKAVVGLLNGYISLLGKDMTSLLLSLPHVSRLLRVLVQVLELDVFDQKILEESGMGARSSTNVSKFVQRVSVMKPRKVFVHFRDDHVHVGLVKACRQLGYLGDVSVLVECVLDVYRESAAHQLSCVLIINEILTGYSQRLLTSEGADSSAHSTQDLVRMLLEEFLSYDNMTLTDAKTSTELVPLSPVLSALLMLTDSEDPSAKQTAMSRNRAIMLTCLFLEGVAVCAKVMGRGFRLVLMDVLYPVSEKMGSEISAVSSTAYLTLSDIADACCYKDVDDLIQSNSDYLVNSISLRLRHFERHPRSPSVLSVMLQLCNTNILLLVWDSIVEVLDSLDEHHAEQAATFLPVLYHLMLAVARWYPSQKTANSSSKSKASRTSHNTKPGPEEIVKYFEDRRQTLLEAEAYDREPEKEDVAAIQEEAERRRRMGEEEEQEGEGDGGMKEEEKKETPLHVKAVKEVLDRAKHIVSSRNPRLALLALDVVAQGCIDLADHENDLLPMVHQLWPSFKQRFYHADKVVVIKAVQTLHTLCSCCGDFVRQRVEKDVLPSFKSFLEKQAHTSLKSGGSYLFTMNFKLQLKMLGSLGDMARMMELDGVVFEQMVYCCLPYLSERQPTKLQQACMDSVKQLMCCDADVVWLALMGLHAPSLPHPPLGAFKPITVFKNVGERNEFSTNVSVLLEQLR